MIAFLRQIASGAVQHWVRQFEEPSEYDLLQEGFLERCSMGGQLAYISPIFSWPDCHRIEASVQIDKALSIRVQAIVASERDDEPFNEQDH